MVRNGRSLTRRTALKTIGGTALAATGLAGATPAVAGGISQTEYDETVDIVADFGADPTGEEPIDDALAEAVTDDTKVVFPEGRYLVSETFTRWGSADDELRNVALVGAGEEPGDVTITPPVGTQQYVFFLGGDAIRVENMAFDESTEDTSTGLVARCDDDLVLRDLRFLGPAGGPGVAEVVDSPVEVDVAGPFNIIPGVRDPDGVGLIENVHAPDGSVDHYRKGAVFLDNGNTRWARHAGHLLFHRCSFERFTDNAIYGSSAGQPGAGGSVGVENCFFRNNTVTAIRLGSSGSYAKNCTVVYDGDGNPPLPWGGTAGRAGWVWYDFDGSYKNIDVVLDNPNGFGFYTHPSHSEEFTLENWRVRVDDVGPVVQAQPGPAASIENLSVTGESDLLAAIQLFDRDAEIKNACIDQPSAGRNGVVATGSAQVQVKNSYVEVGGDAFAAVDDAEIEVINRRQNGNCPPAQREHSAEQ